MTFCSTPAGRLTSRLGSLTTAAAFVASSTFLQADIRAVVDFGAYGASALNGKGQAALNENQGRAFAGLWQSGVVRPLGGESPGFYSAALGLNDHGLVVGYGPGVSCAGCAVAVHAIVWQPNGTQAILPHLPADTARGRTDGSEARAINNTGDIVGWSFRGVPGRGGWQRAVRWRGGRAHELATGADGLSSAALSINEGGDVVGWAELTRTGGRPAPRRAVLWSGTTVTDLGSLAGVAGSSVAYKVNDKRTVVGTSDAAGGGKRAFRWEGKAMTALNPLDGDTDSEAFAVNNRGVVAGTSSKSSCPTCAPRAVVWRGGVATDLNTQIPAASGWQLREAVDIDDTGRVIGRGTLDGESRFFLLEL